MMDVLGRTSGDADGDVGQRGDSIWGPCEEAADDLRWPHTTTGKRTERQLGSQCENLLPPLPHESQ